MNVIASIVQELSKHDAVTDHSMFAEWVEVPTAQAALDLQRELAHEGFYTATKVLNFLESRNLPAFKRILDEVLVRCRVNDPKPSPAFNVKKTGDRELFALAVRHYPPGEEADAIVLEAARSADATIAASAFERLSSIKKHSTVATLVGGLSHSSAEVRSLAVEGLAKRSVESLYPVFDQLVRDESPLVRLAVAGALERVDADSRAEMLSTLMDDVDWEVADAATRLSART